MSENKPNGMPTEEEAKELFELLDRLERRDEVSRYQRGVQAFTDSAPDLVEDDPDAPDEGGHLLIDRFQPIAMSEEDLHELLITDDGEEDEDEDTPSAPKKRRNPFVALWEGFLGNIPTKEDSTGTKIRKGGFLFSLLVMVVVCHLLRHGRQLADGGTKSGDKGRGFCAGAQTPLLLAAKLTGQDACTTAQIQSAHALGSVNLMGADRHRVQSPTTHTDGHLASRLHRIAVDVRLWRHTADGRHRLLNGESRADFVIHQHHRHQHRIGTAGRDDSVGCQHAVFVGEQACDGVSLFFQSVDRRRHRGVLYGGGDDVATIVRMGGHRTENGEIIGFGAAGGEGDFPRLCSDEGSDLTACGGKLLLRAKAQRVEGAGIAVYLGHQPIGGIRRRTAHPCGGAVIQIGL